MKHFVFQKTWMFLIVSKITKEQSPYWLGCYPPVQWCNQGGGKEPVTPLSVMSEGARFVRVCSDMKCLRFSVFVEGPLAAKLFNMCLVWQYMLWVFVDSFSGPRLDRFKGPAPVVRCCCPVSGEVCLRERSVFTASVGARSGFLCCGPALAAVSFWKGPALTANY